MSPKVTNPINTPIGHAGSNRISVGLIIAFVITISWITWFSQVDQFQRQEHFSEFYIKDSKNLLKTNTLELSENEEGTFRVVIVNHEGTISNYRIHVLVNGHQISSIDNIQIEDRRKGETQIKLSFLTAGDNQNVDILLEKEGSSFPYRELHLFANVSSTGKDTP
jgi:uncharacterized membrane protein